MGSRHALRRQHGDHESHCSRRQSRALDRRSIRDGRADGLLLRRQPPARVAVRLSSHPSLRSSITVSRPHRLARPAGPCVRDRISDSRPPADRRPQPVRVSKRRFPRCPRPCDYAVRFSRVPTLRSLATCAVRARLHRGLPATPGGGPPPRSSSTCRAHLAPSAKVEIPKRPGLPQRDRIANVGPPNVPCRFGRVEIGVQLRFAWNACDADGDRRLTSPLQRVRRSHLTRLAGRHLATPSTSHVRFLE